MMTTPVIISHHSHHPPVIMMTRDDSPSHHPQTPHPSDFEAHMMTKQQIPPSIDSQQTPVVESVSTKTQNVSTNKVHTQDCRICVGDFVRYVGDNQSLRVQCGHSKRDGVRVTAIEGNVAFIKAPKWICDYRVSVAELVLERRGNVPPAKTISAVGGNDDDLPF
jgi:hypothetical protein